MACCPVSSARVSREAGVGGSVVPIVGINEPRLLEMLATMWLIRAFEERVAELNAKGELGGLLHLGIGQEAVAAGCCLPLRRGDLVYGSHRAHAHALAKGADPTRLLAELAGRATGYCAGKGGTMHISAPEVGFMTATGVVAGNIPLALGAADVCRRRGAGDIAIAFFGDGAAQTGSFHESLNLAALWQLPVVLVCENNGWAEFTPLSAHTRVERLGRHAETYEIATLTVDGNDVLAVREAMSEAVARARVGSGPTFLECLTQRLRGHYEGDPGRYRDRAALEEWKAKDPIQRFQRVLAQREVAFDADQLEADARSRVEQAVVEAFAAPWPAEEDVASQVYADG